MANYNHNAVATDPFKALRGLFVVILLVVAVVVGKLIPSQPIIAVGVAILPIAIMLVFKNPFLLFCFYVTIMFGGFGWLPLDDMLHIPGLAKVSDLIGLIMASSLIINYGMRVDNVQRLKKNPYTRPMIVFVLYALWIHVYTVVYWHEDPLLAFRVGRKYFIYGLPLMGFIFLWNQRQWKVLEGFCLAAIYGTFVANIAEVTIDVPWLNNLAEQGAERFGVFKTFVPVKFITSLFLVRYLWMYMHKPTKKTLLMLLSVAVPFVFYLFRGLIAGLVAGIFVTTFFMAPRVRLRTYAFLISGGMLGVVSAILFASIATHVSFGEMAHQFFVDYLSEVFHMGSAVSGQVKGYDTTFAYRMLKAQERLPLVYAHPYFGIGCVSPWGTVAWELYMQGTMPLGDVDSGWLDVLMRLGGVGAVVLIWFYFVLMKKIGSQFRRYMKSAAGLSLYDQAWMMGTLAIMVQVLVALVSSANITRPATITAISIGLIKCMQIWDRRNRVDGSDNDKNRERPVDSDQVNDLNHIPDIDMADQLQSVVKKPLVVQRRLRS